MPLITRSEAARRMNVTVQAVYGAIKEGRIKPVTNEEGKVFINSDTLMEEWTKNSQFMRVKSQSYKPKKQIQTPTRVQEAFPEYNESKARTEHLKAELLELEKQEKEESLVSAKDVEAMWVTVGTVVRTKLLGISSKAKQRLPDLDTSAIACIDDIVREALEEIAVA